MAKERIGLVGPGRMGLAMVKHLIKGGYPVTVTDLNADAIKKAEAVGAQGVATAAELAKVSKFIIVAVGFDDEAMAVTNGKNGLMDGLQPGSIVAVSMTCTIAAQRSMWRKKSCPRPRPSLAPSISPGTSATVKVVSPAVTTPRFGTSVVKG